MDQVLAKLERLSGQQNIGAIRQLLDLYRQAEDAEAEAALLARFHARMWDVSAFMKMLKQRFTLWYNRRLERKGTLWEERFRSVVVEGAGRALSAMAAYIDLNPVRAGLAKDPKDYRWCGYGEAVAGKKRAREGILAVVKALQRGEEAPPRKALELYRMQLFRVGDAALEPVRADGTRARAGLSHEAVLEVLEKKGKLPLQEYLKCRVRYFCDGTALGSREFVEGLYEAYRERFGKKRKAGAQRMQGVEEELYTLRNLRVKVFG